MNSGEQTFHMRFRDALTAFSAQRLTATELADILDQALAETPRRGDELQEQLNTFKRDVGLPSEIYQILCARIDAAKSRESPLRDEATVVASQTSGSHYAGDDAPTVMAARADLSASAAPASSRALRHDPAQEATVLAVEGTASPSPHREVDTSHQERPKPGMILKNRFVLEEVLGVGGMSVVFRALDLRKEEAQDRAPHVAIKVLGPEFKNHPDSLKVLQREAKKAQTLAHPNIINVYDFDRDGDTIFMIMEILEGQGLDKVIKANRLGGLPLAEVLPMVEGMAQALGYAHKKNIVHSDLKPGNIYLTKDNTIKVLDFGIARARRDGGSDSAEADNFDAGNLGALTLAYASCEMSERLEPDPRDDIYALGCITYELLTGRHPFGRKPAVQARDAHLQAESIAGLKRRQWTVLCQALAFKREERLADVLQFYNEFKPHRIPWRWIGLAAIIAAGLLGGWIYNAYQNKQLAQEIGDDLARRAPVQLTAEQQARIKDLLDTGKLYLSLGQYAAPPGDSAFDAYQKILEIDPRNAEARDAERKIADYYEGKARSAMEQRDPVQAKAMIDLGLYVRPGDEGLLSMQKALNGGK